MPHSSLTLCAAIAVGAMLLPGGSRAEMPAPAADIQPLPVTAQIVEDTGGSARIDLSGKLRMLSQRLPSALCAVEAGLASEAQAVLDGAAGEGDTILAALRDGNDGRGVFGPETDRKLIRGIELIEEVWTPMRDQALDVAKIGPTAVDVASVQEKSHEVLTRAKALVSVMTAEYSNPAELLQADAITIDIAGRQRMLTQRIAKDACLLGSGHTANDLAADLGRTMRTYETSLDALRGGMPDAGIVPPPSAAIHDGLEEIAVDWNALRHHLVTLRDGGAVSRETRTALFLGLNALTAKMNTVVGLYADASKLGL